MTEGLLYAFQVLSFAEIMESSAGRDCLESFLKRDDNHSLLGYASCVVGDFLFRLNLLSVVKLFRPRSECNGTEIPMKVTIYAIYGIQIIESESAVAHL